MRKFFVCNTYERVRGRWSGSVASKGLSRQHELRRGVAFFVLFFSNARLAKDALLGDDETDGKAVASCRTPNKKRQPRLPLFASSHTLTRNNYTTRSRDRFGKPPRRQESCRSPRLRALLNAGLGRKWERALRILEGELRNTAAEHGFETVLGSLEEFVGLAVALLGVLQMGSQSSELVREFFHLLFHPGEIFQEALGILFHLHTAKAHRYHAKMRV